MKTKISGWKIPLVSDDLRKTHSMRIQTKLALSASILLVLAFLVGFKPAIEQWSWKLASRNFAGWDIAATSENNIVLVGSHILHYNGLFWRRAFFPLQHAADEERQERMSLLDGGNPSWPTVRWFDAFLTDACAYDRTHIYAVGAAGILEYNGLWWSSMPVAPGLLPHPNEIWVQNPESIYALDSEYGTLYWDGKQWDKLLLPVEGDIIVYAVGGTSDSVVITGSYDAGEESGSFLLIYKNGAWRTAEIPHSWQGLS